MYSAHIEANYKGHQVARDITEEDPLTFYASVAGAVEGYVVAGYHVTELKVLSPWQAEARHG